MKGLDSERVSYVSLLAVFGALFGARIYFMVAQSLALSPGCFLFTFWKGGTGSSGAWIGALLGIYAGTRLFSINLWRYLDSGALAIALAIFLGRIGCFIKGCCFGSPTNLPWAVVFPQDSPAYHRQIDLNLIDTAAAAALPVHPVQLYEALLALAILAVTIVVLKRAHSDGHAFLFVFIAYSVSRFFLELLRGDARPFFLALSAPQWIYLGFAMLAILAYLHQARFKSAKF